MKTIHIIKTFVIAAITLMMVQSAQADSAVVTRPTPGNQNAGVTVPLYRQLVDLRSQNVILAESLKNAELKNKLNSVDKNPTMVPSLEQYLPSGNNSQDMSASTHVQMVSGSGNNLTAVILLAGGNRITTRVGSSIPGLGVVKSISLNEVEVENKKQTTVLTFASDTSH